MDVMPSCTVALFTVVCRVTDMVRCAAGAPGARRRVRRMPKARTVQALRPHGGAAAAPAARKRSTAPGARAYHEVGAEDAKLDVIRLAQNRGGILEPVHGDRGLRRPARPSRSDGGECGRAWRRLRNDPAAETPAKSGRACRERQFSRCSSLHASPHRSARGPPCSSAIFAWVAPREAGALTLLPWRTPQRGVHTSGAAQAVYKDPNFPLTHDNRVHHLDVTNGEGARLMQQL